MKEISLRPYSGRLFYVSNRDEWEKAHKKLFKTDDVLMCGQEGKFLGEQSENGVWQYLVYAQSPEVIAHEFSHVIFHVFECAGINAHDSRGEAFCYMLSQLMLDAK